jgi:hypothetical protein
MTDLHPNRLNIINAHQHCSHTETDSSANSLINTARKPTNNNTSSSARAREARKISLPIAIRVRLRPYAIGNEMELEKEAQLRPYAIPRIAKDNMT